MKRASFLLLLIALGCGEKDGHVDSPGDDSGTGGDDSGDSTDADGDGFEAGVDCDDADAAVHPGADEVCDGVDNDCDGGVDLGASDARAWYADADGDGHGDAEASELACAPPTGFVELGDDCDDADPSAYPGAPEVCDGDDESCDGLVDEDAVDAPTWYADADGDGHGVDSEALTQCAQPSGYAAEGGDCDDADPGRHPGADEVCDDDDEDCDANVDEEPIDGGPWYYDVDGDGYGDESNPIASCERPSGTYRVGGDCLDSDADVYPGSHAREVPFDGVDTDCNGNDFCDDLNCDGWPDLIQVDEYEDGYEAHAFAFYFDGTEFSDDDQDALPTFGARDGEVADLNGDGYPDLVVPSRIYEYAYDIDSRIYWGSASGLSASRYTELDTTGAISVRIHDIDDDGYLDLLFTSFYDGASYEADNLIFWGSSAGYSNSDVTALPGFFTRETAVEDLDGDGYNEVIVCSSADGSNSRVDSYVYWGSSAGWSESDRTALPVMSCYDVKVADLNLDGYPDIVFANYWDSWYDGYYTDSYIYWGSSSGYSTADREDLPTEGVESVTAGDFNADGYPDLVFGGFFLADWNLHAQTRVYWGSSSGFSSSNITELSPYGSRRVVVEDLDKDGYPELINPTYRWRGVYEQDSYIYWGSAAGWSESDRTDIPTVGPIEAAVGDINRDGYADVVFNGLYGSSAEDVANAYVYYGTFTGYSASDRDALTTYGSTAAPIIVGDASW